MRKVIQTKGFIVLAALLVLMLVAAACGGETKEKAVIKFSDQSWDTLWLHNAIAMYVTEQGYGYPVEEVVGTTGTMKVALPIGDLDVAMEMWRTNIRDWYDEFVVEKKQVVDLAGTKESVANGAKGQTLEATDQGWYVPAYVIAQNPGLKSVSDLPNYKHLFTDPEDASKGVWVNCIIGWECQKRYRAKALAYGLNEHYNVIEPGSSAALAAAIKGAYDAGEPVLSYYWEPTKLLAELDMVQLEEPPWTQACADAISAGTAAEPYESPIGCHDALDDVHTGVTASLVDRAPEVTEFLGNLFVGSLALEDLAAWKKDNDKEWRDAAVKWLRANEATWSTWITEDARKRMKLFLLEKEVS